MDYGPNLHNIYMSSTYSLWNKNTVIQTQKISKTYRSTLQTDFFFALQIKLRVLTLPVPTGTKSRAEWSLLHHCQYFTVAQWPLNARWTKRAFHLQGNYILNKNVNVLKCSPFFEEFLLFYVSHPKNPWYGRKQGFLNHFTVLWYFCSAFREKEVGKTELWLNYSPKRQTCCTVAVNQR